MKKVLVISSAVMAVGVFASPIQSIHATGNTDGQEQSIDKNALIGRGGNGIWTRPYGEQTANYIGDISLYAGNIVHITSSITYGNVTWYYIQVNGKPIGWVDSQALENNIPPVTTVST